MPRQGLFEGERVLDLLDEHDDVSSDEGVSHPQFYPDPAGVATPNQSYNNFNDSPVLPPREPPAMNFVSLFQEQQAMLQTVIKQQQNMLKQQEQIIEKQKFFEEKIAHLEDMAESPENASKCKSKVPRELTVS